MLSVVLGNAGHQRLFVQRSCGALGALSGHPCTACSRHGCCALTHLLRPLGSPSSGPTAALLHCLALPCLALQLVLSPGGNDSIQFPQEASSWPWEYMQVQTAESRPLTSTADCSSHPAICGLLQLRGQRQRLAPSYPHSDCTHHPRLQRFHCCSGGHLRQR